jgi:hypothetical protein
VSDEIVAGQDLQEEMQEIERVKAYLQEKGYWENVLTAEDAMNVANLSRYSGGTVSPQLAAAVAAGGLPYDIPGMDQIMLRDAAEVDRSWWRGPHGILNEWLYNPVQGLTRGAVNTFDWFQEEAVKRPVKALYRMGTEGESWNEAMQRAGPSDTTLRLREHARGNPINEGSGWLPQSTLAHETPGFRERVRGLEEQGLAEQDAFIEASNLIYDEIGQPITYEGDDRRSQTLVAHQRSNGERIVDVFSPGRGAAVAMDVFEQGTLPYQFFSGTIDGIYTVATDPLNVPLDELAKFAKATQLIVPPGTATGMKAKGWRPYVNSMTAEMAVNDTRWGQRLVNRVTAESSFDENWRLLGQFGHQLVEDVTRAKNPEVVRQLLVHALGKNVTDVTDLKKPFSGLGYQRRQLLNAKVRDQETGVLSVLNKEGYLAATKRRLYAETGSSELDPQNIDESIGIARNWMDTARLPRAVKDSILMDISKSGGTFNGMRKARKRIETAVENKLVDLGYDRLDARAIIKDSFGSDDLNRIYNQDVAGHPITPYGTKFYTVVNPDGSESRIPFHGASLDSELAQQTVALPSFRDIRVNTSGTQMLRNKFRQHNVIQPYADVPRTDTGWLIATGDFIMGTFRSGALLRPAWPMRILPEEMVRWMFSGYNDLFAHPISYFALLLRDGLPIKGLTDADGNRLRLFATGKGKLDIEGLPIEDLEDAKKLGTGGFQRDIHNEPVIGTRTEGTRFDARRAGWTMGEVRDSAGNWTRHGIVGMARDMFDLSRSILAQVVAEMGVDDAFRYFRDAEGEGPEILARIMREAASDNTLSQLNVDAILRDKLREIEFKIENIAGGKTRWFDESEAVPGGQTGVWRRGDGSVVDDAEQLALSERADFDQNFWIVDPGEQRVRDFIAQGGIDGVGDDAVYYIHDSMSAGDFNRLEEFVPTMYGAQFQPPRRVKAPAAELSNRLNKTRMRKAADFLFKWLGEKPTAKVIREPFAITRYWEQAGRMYWGADSATKRFLDAAAKEAKMTVEFKRFKNKALKYQYNGRVPPTVALGHSTSTTDHVFHGAPDEFGGDVTIGGFARDPGRSANYADETTTGGGRAVHRGEVEPTEAGAVVYVYARDDLPDSVRTTIDGGSDVEEVFTESIWRSRGEEQWRSFEANYDTDPVWVSSLEEIIGDDAVDQAWFMDMWMGAGRDDFYTDVAQYQGKIPDEILPDSSFLPVGQMTPEEARIASKSGIIPDSAFYDQGTGGFTHQEIDVASRMWALQETRDLFYDLQRRGNWADASRLIFPFGDAFKEIVTAWAKNLDPTGISPRALGAKRVGVGSQAQALRNWNRINRVYQAQSGQQGGFFSEDQFGNQVFNMPTIPGLVEGLVQKVDPKFQMPGTQLPGEWQSLVTPDALSFIDSGVRMVFGPGVGPLIQIPTSILGDAVPEGWWKDLGMSYVYGDYQPVSGSLVEKIYEPIIPTWTSKTIDFFEAVGGDEMRGVYADEAGQALLAAVISDPQFRFLDKQGIDKLLEEVLPVAKALALTDVLNSIFAPAKGTNYPSIEVQDFWNLDEPSKMMTISALAAERNAAVQWYDGDVNRANAYIIERFGLDPLLLAGKTVAIVDAPTTKIGWTELDANPDLKQMPLTMMMFIAEDPDAEFWYPAWIDQIEKEKRQQLTPDLTVRMITQATGNRAHAVLIERYEREKLEAAATFGLGSNNYREFMTRLDEWKDLEEIDIGTQYYSWDEDNKFDIYGRADRPTTTDYLKELREIGTPGKELNRIGREYNLGFTKFIEAFDSAMEEAEQASLLYGNDEDWWRESPAASTRGTGFVNVERLQAIRDHFVFQINSAASRLTDPQDILGAKWLQERVVTPMVNDFWIEGEILFMPRPLPTRDATKETQDLANMRRR